MKIIKIWFDADYIYGVGDDGKEYRQSLLWYPGLKEASDAERANYRFGFRGIHWRDLDEDISFESFADEDAEPSAFQRFFLTHKEIKQRLKNNLANFFVLFGIFDFSKQSNIPIYSFIVKAEYAQK